MRETVLFSQGVRELLQVHETALIEVGPRNTLTMLARQQIAGKTESFAVSSLADSADDQREWHTLQQAAGHLWTHGITVDWAAWYAGQQRRRVPLPTYPFERKRFWIDPKEVAQAAPVALPMTAIGEMMKASPQISSALFARSKRFSKRYRG